MTRFVAFLRGINVGGRTVKKETLQEAFTSLGFENFSTFRQSGNVVFDAESAYSEAIVPKIEAKLQNTLGYAVPVFLRTLPELKKIVDAEPFKNQNKEGSSFLVTFLANTPTTHLPPLPLTIPKSTAQIIAAKDRAVFSVTHGGGEGGLPNPYLEKTLKAKATTRNMNIIVEIVQNTVKQEH
jgi:uncharacterized protein (DUF1697 family)